MIDSQLTGFVECFRRSRGLPAAAQEEEGHACALELRPDLVLRIEAEPGDAFMTLSAVVGRLPEPNDDDDHQDPYDFAASGQQASAGTGHSKNWEIDVDTRSGELILRALINLSGVDDSTLERCIDSFEFAHGVWSALLAPAQDPFAAHLGSAAAGFLRA